MTHTESSCKHPSCIALGFPVPEGVCSCSQTHIVLLLWELQGLQNLFRIFWKVWDCLSRKCTAPHTHSSLFPLLCLPSFLFLTFTHSFKKNHWISNCWQTSQNPWTTLPSPWTPGRTVPLRTRNRTHTEYFTWDIQENAEIIFLSMGKPFLYVSEQCATRPPSPIPPECWEPGAPGADSTCHRVCFLRPREQCEMRGGAGIWGALGSSSPGSTVRRMSGLCHSGANPLCSEVTCSDVPSHRTVALYLHSHVLLTLESH